MKVNYQKVLDEIIEQNLNNNKVPTLLLHSCCAPCSSYVLEYLSNYFQITIFYYNPNISPKNEFDKRVDEQKRLLSILKTKNPISFIVGNYDNDRYEKVIKGLENEPERGKRCYICYKLRLEECAKLAKKLEFDYFATTLSISPYKNSDWINEIGRELEQDIYVKYLYADFKKKNGYKRSIELSNIYHLYRQNYCGCIYSKKEDRIYN